MSVRFEVRVRSVGLPQTTLVGPLDLKRFGEFAPDLAVIEVDMEAPSLPFRLVGSSVGEYFNGDLMDMNYLDIVAPSARQAAYDAAVVMVHHPCGLWQVIPARTNEGSTVYFEYTGFPILKESHDHAVIFLVRPCDEAVAALPLSIIATQEPVCWHWLDLGAGEPRADTLLVD